MPTAPDQNEACRVNAAAGIRRLMEQAKEDIILRPDPEFYGESAVELAELIAGTEGRIWPEEQVLLVVLGAMLLAIRDRGTPGLPDAVPAPPLPPVGYAPLAAMNQMTQMVERAKFLPDPATDPAAFSEQVRAVTAEIASTIALGRGRLSDADVSLLRKAGSWILGLADRCQTAGGEDGTHGG